jgi:hypothetical protein
MCCAGAFTDIFSKSCLRSTERLESLCASAARIAPRHCFRHELLQSHQRFRTLASRSCTWPSPKHFLYRIQAVTITTNATTAGTPASDAPGTSASAARKACSECRRKHIKCDRPTTGAPCTGCRRARGGPTVCAV